MGKKSIEIAVIGLGRFGAFWAKHLSKYYPVYGFDIDNSKKTKFESIGSWEGLKSCLKKDFVFLTIPIRKIEEFLQQNAKHFGVKSVVIDCASVKMCVVNWFEKYLSSQTYYSACHPLFGPDSAKTGLQNQQITLMPGRINYLKYQQLVSIFRQDLNLKIIHMTAEEHDQMMAYNLSFIHHLGRCFHDMEIFKVPLQMAGLEKLNHISEVVMNDSDALFEDFYKYNVYAEKVKNKFLDSFEKINPLKE